MTTTALQITMPLRCDIILRWGATPDQLTALGLALWGWCLRVSGDAGIYPCLDNQTLSDLIAGDFPAGDQTRGPLAQRGIHFRVWGETAHGGAATVAALRRAIPAAGVEDILVAGKSWKQAG